MKHPREVIVVTCGDRTVAVDPSKRKGRTLIDEALAADADLTSAMTPVLRRLRKHGCTRATIVLGAPFADARMLDLPRLELRRLSTLVARDAAQWFIGVECSMVASVGPPPGARRSTRFLCSAAPRDLVEALTAAARSEGFQSLRVTSIWHAWAAGLGHSGVRSHAGAVGFVVGQRIELLTWDGKGLLALRRVVRAHAGRRLPLLTEGRPLRLVTSGDDAPLLEAQLGGVAGMSVDCSDDPFLCAARGASAAGRYEFLTQTLLATRSARRRRWRLVTATLSALLLGAAAAADGWQQRRDLADVRAQRSAVAVQVAEAQSLRDTAEARLAYLTSILTYQQSHLAWSAVLTDLAELLPVESHLQSLAGESDSLTLVVRGGDVAAVLHSLKTPAAVREARLIDSPRSAAITADDQEPPSSIRLRLTTWH
jgi:Tfp pilus assembly protein PilN